MIGKLLDSGVAPESICWVDPHFAVGDFGRLWSAVPSNTKVAFFIQYLTLCRSFEVDGLKDSALFSLDPDVGCDLGVMATVLAQVTARLCQLVRTTTQWVTQITADSGGWVVQASQSCWRSAKVVLATGAVPNVLAYPDVDTIDLATALDPAQLAASVSSQDRVAVFGSSHSAVLVCRALLESGVKQVVNFYRSPLRYAMMMDDWILFDNTGLKGEAAAWARTQFHAERYPQLVRHYASDEHILEHLPECNKVVYAVGFTPRREPLITGFPQVTHNNKTGIIAPGLFGAGIAFPEGVYDRLLNFEHNVGLLKFMRYIDRVMPIWLRYSA